MTQSRVFGFLIGLGMAFLPVGAFAADQYDESQSNPLRIVAYAVHPVGVILEWAVARPLHWLVSATPEQEYLFGHRPHPPMFDDVISYDFGVAKPVFFRGSTAAPKRISQEPMAERVTIQPVTVEKIVIKEVPQVTEVERVVFPDIAFQFDSSRMTDLGKGKTYLVAQKLKEKADVVVVVEGHADSMGSDKYNRVLGLRRAETIKNELVKLGVDPARLSVESLGESRPILTQDAEWARAVNRRVEFKVAAQ